MAKQFKNINSLVKHLQTQVNDVLSKEVANKSKIIMSEVIDDYVYGAYTPYNATGSDYHYHRTYKLGDIKNIETKMVNGVLVVKNIAYDNSVLGVIEYGQGYEWGISRNLDDEIGTRPFHEITAQKLKDGIAVNELRNGLKKRGIKVK